MRHSQFIALMTMGMALCGAPSNASELKETPLKGDSTIVVPRTYMGETVLVKENPNFYAGPNPSWWSGVRATGSLQTEFMVPFEDEAILTGTYDHHLLNNTYFDFTVNAPYVSAGARFQFTKYPLPGFVPEFEGWGVPYFWATGRYKGLQVTAGDFYEQFGSGLIMRTYQERSLGVDGAIRGGRIKLNPVSGLYLTALAGKERYFWKHNPDWIWGGDAEWSLDESFSNAFGQNYGATLGFSYVGKKDADNFINHGKDEHLVFPSVVAAFDARAKLRLHNFNILAEWARKNNDPDGINKYIYKPGHVELLSVSYANKGFSAFIQAKRSENMSFMSDQMIDGLNGNGYINYLPAFTTTQTYTLAALYPYATNYNGEWAFQGQVGYLFKRGTPLGGKYGTSVRLSASYISDLDRQAPLGANEADPALVGSNGLGAAYWKIGSLRYSDLNFEINKKFNKHLQFTLFYFFQKFSYDKIFGAHGVPMMTANTFILEGQWKMKKRTQLRWELQYLTTKQYEGDWMAGLVELSVAPHWMFTLTDTYNVGKTNLNYYSAMVTYVYKANRFALSYGRNREGYNCAGGVCRWIPATKGFSLSYNYTF